MRTVFVAATIAIVCISGCQESPAPTPRVCPVELQTVHADVVRAPTGFINGRVVWEGSLPHAPNFKAYANRVSKIGNQFTGEKPNLNVPIVDPETLGVHRAVVFLRAVEADRSRPWDHAPVRVVFENRALHVFQGESRGTIGFVRRGDDIEAVNHDPYFHQLKGRGAAFFSLPFVKSNVPTRRRLDAAGLVELTGGNGQFWMQAYLFVADHPYYCLTDEAGRFTLAKVPPGRYHLACWLPNWQVVSREREPEFGLVTRVIYAPHLTIEQTIDVKREGASEAEFKISAEQFSKP